MNTFQHTSKPQVLEKKMHFGNMKCMEEKERKARRGKNICYCCDFFIKLPISSLKMNSPSEVPFRLCTTNFRLQTNHLLLAMLQREFPLK